jgi:hypothetical protein
MDPQSAVPCPDAQEDRHCRTDAPRRDRLALDGDKQARPFLPAPGSTVMAGFWFYAD